MNKIGTCSCEKTRMFENKIQIQGEGYHAKTHIKSYMERITHGWKWPHGTRQRCISRTILGRFTIRIGGWYESRRIDCGSSCRLFFHSFLTNSWKRGIHARCDRNIVDGYDRAPRRRLYYHDDRA